MKIKLKKGFEKRLWGYVAFVALIWAYFYATRGNNLFWAGMPTVLTAIFAVLIACVEAKIDVEKH